MSACLLQRATCFLWDCSPRSQVGGKSRLHVAKRNAIILLTCCFCALPFTAIPDVCLSICAVLSKPSQRFQMSACLSVLYYPSRRSDSRCLPVYLCCIIQAVTAIPDVCLSICAVLSKPLLIGVIIMSTLQLSWHSDGQQGIGSCHLHLLSCF